MNNESINLSKCIEIYKGKKKAAYEILSMFMKELEQHRGQIKKNFNEKNYDELHDQVHKINGASSFVSVPKLGMIAYNLETAIKGKDTEKMKKLVDEIESEMDEVSALYESEIADKVKIELEK